MILVTGGTGFLGSTLIKLLIEQGNAIVATKRASSAIPDFLKSSSLIQWVDADVTDYFALADIFHDISQVYHCAAKVSYQKEDIQELYSVNVDGTSHIVNLCLEHRARLVHVSSIAALGSSKNKKPVNEADKWEYDPKMSNYALSKYKGELEVWRGINEGLEAVIVNPSVIMGIGSYKKGSGAIFELVNNGIKIFTAGSVGIVDVVDVTNIMIQLMNSSVAGERFILNSENISNKDLLSRIAVLIDKKPPTIKANSLMLSIAWRAAKIMSKITGKKPVITEESARAASELLAYSNEKITTAIDYTFIPLDSTLKEIANTYYNKTQTI
ncbi:NAD-dependent epimerase/dehydratase family protein [Sphingobacterium bovistauri]|uniref:NAD-dependent epimerase/dehydratase family protein n=1 Tax=Sphingobacterium bovistauri TaxID=2781959 RepID=A0ABS7Z2Z6_9SPHI|nr:NAD-dependent epimerase/dehydratase family protein [Sphingobacterium bovistauri]MCA5004323.1 NAD-dependent epimerase/dehydratase family protein [Sphingobacterium bovistauri]